MLGLISWFSALSTGAKVAVITGTSVVGIGAISAATSHPPEPQQPAAVIEEIKQEKPEDVTEVKTEVTTKEIPFKTTEEEDPNSDAGTETVAVEGKNGTEEIAYEVTYVNGKETSRKEVSSKITKKAINRVVLVGTYVAPAPATAAPTPATSSCDPNYSGGCVPIVGYDLDCPDIGFSVVVVGSDPHGFDGNDNDGLGCESY